MRWRPRQRGRRSANGEVDYRSFDTPTVVRNQPPPMRDAGNAARALDEDPDYLDIPAFLRRQAD